MKTIIIGMGEIGSSLSSVLEQYNPDCIDINESCPGKFDIMHICFPYSEGFVNAVQEYKTKYDPKYVVIHSTVPVGTSRSLNAVHSPVVGMHPDLTKSLKTFIKFIGGNDASCVADYFRRAGLKVYLTDKQETTELAKIQCTTFYALCIEFFKEMKDISNENNVPFEFWTLWNENYNDGYKKLNHPEFTRPNLTPIMKQQGGHCTLNNLDLLGSMFTIFLKEIT